MHRGARVDGNNIGREQPEPGRIVSGMGGGKVASIPCEDRSHFKACVASFMALDQEVFYLPSVLVSSFINTRRLVRMLVSQRSSQCRAGNGPK